MSREYDFTLALTGVTELTPHVVDRLYEAGLDDATLALRYGRAYATFSREAASMKEAVLSAIADVRDAGVGANVLRVDECNLVTQAEIARRSGRSRQMIHQYINGKRGPGGFPPPVCDLCEGSPLWAWCEVASWLFENNLVKEELFRDAEEIDAINLALELGQIREKNPALAEEILKSVGAG
ncbi:MAG: helix-turn-helix transcriptional regulator [Planctomycetaceae bacterium]